VVFLEKPEIREQRTESRDKRTEIREQRQEQRTENREQRAENGKVGVGDFGTSEGEHRPGEASTVDLG
jgi:hypothetical protein